MHLYQYYSQLVIIPDHTLEKSNFDFQPYYQHLHVDNSRTIGYRCNP